MNVCRLCLGDRTTWCSCSRVNTRNTFIDTGSTPSASERAGTLRGHRSADVSLADDPPIQHRQIDEAGTFVLGSPDSADAPSDAQFADIPIPESQDSAFSFGAATASNTHDVEVAEITNALISLSAADGSSATGSSNAPRADVPLSEEAAPCDPFATGDCHCPWCPGSFFHIDTAFVRHLICMHEGVTIDNTRLQLLRGLGPGACPKAGCGCLRRNGSRHCHRCGESHSSRRICCW